MYRLHYNHRIGQSDVVPLWLALVLFTQGLVPIQAHTNWIDVNGQLVLVCSWNGRHEITPSGDGAAPIQPGDQRTPAIVFSELLISVILPVVLEMPGALFRLAAWPVERSRVLVFLRRPYRQTIRAPPRKLRL